MNSEKIVKLAKHVHQISQIGERLTLTDNEIEKLREAADLLLKMDKELIVFRERVADAGSTSHDRLKTALGSFAAERHSTGCNMSQIAQEVYIIMSSLQMGTINELVPNRQDINTYE